MGEVVVSCEDGIEVIMDKEEKGYEEKKENKEGSSSMVKWERFLPRMALRVLLVEADDSTRQIIGALLRKCSYKVASVPDGLKAWEVLKARPHNIDLILTEVELPSISGYALLTLIMEHEICKNIPVIMMSKYDSVSTVYKCMLRGAADFLVKPVRINELKNLWQHVWRRHSMNREGGGCQDESVGQQKLEATDENIATSDHSSSSKTCALRQEECIRKGSDAQSSCGKPDLVVQSAYVADVEDQSLPNQVKSPASGLNVQESTNIANSGQNLSTAEGAIADPAAYNDNNTPDLCGGMEHQGRGENVNLCTEAINIRDALGNSSREAIDLIGAFNNHSRCNSCPNDGANKFEAPPHLDLSLRRLCSGVVENKSIYEKQMLNHSNASAFTRYINKTPHTSNSNATSSSIPKEDKINSGDHFLENAPGSSTKAKEPKFPYDRKVISLPVNLSKEVENEYQSASQRLFPIPLPVRGIRVDVCSNPAGYGSKTPPIVCTPSPSASPNPATHHLNFFHQHNVDVANARHQYHPLDQSPRVSSNQPISQQDPKLDSLDDRAHLSPATDQSASSTLCNGTAGLPNGFGCATVGGNGQDAVVPGVSEIGNEQNHVTCDLIRQRSIQREAALTKFRLKRKERCYEKKVRYESRKKLAEQRPRVKGQFVRQVPPDPPPKSDNSGGISVGN